MFDPFESKDVGGAIRLVTDRGAGCFACHEANAKDSDYVFSQLR